MRALKANGLITKFPQGRKPGVSGKVRSADRTIARAQRVLEEMMMARRKPTVPELPPEAAALQTRPSDELTTGEKQAVNTGLALDIIRKILELEVDPDNVKLLAQIKDAALTTISQQIRIDEGQMRLPAGEQLVEYTAAVERQEKLLGLRPGKPKPKNKAHRVAEEPS